MGTKGRVKLKRLALLNIVKVFNNEDMTYLNDTFKCRAQVVY